MSGAGFKLEPRARRAAVECCRGYKAARGLCKAEGGEGREDAAKLVSAVNRAYSLIGSDLADAALRRALQRAIWRSTLDARAYPYEQWDIPTVYRNDFYARKRKFLYLVAEFAGLR